MTKMGHQEFYENDAYLKFIISLIKYISFQTLTIVRYGTHTTGTIALLFSCLKESVLINLLVQHNIKIRRFFIHGKIMSNPTKLSGNIYAITKGHQSER